MSYTHFGSFGIGVCGTVWVLTQSSILRWDTNIQIMCLRAQDNYKASLNGASVVPTPVNTRVRLLLRSLPTTMLPVKRAAFAGVSCWCLATVLVRGLHAALCTRAWYVQETATAEIAFNRRTIRQSTMDYTVTLSRYDGVESVQVYHTPFLSQLL